MKLFRLEPTVLYIQIAMQDYSSSRHRTIGNISHRSLPQADVGHVAIPEIHLNLLFKLVCLLLTLSNSTDTKHPKYFIKSTLWNINSCNRGCLTTSIHRSEYSKATAPKSIRTDPLSQTGHFLRKNMTLRYWISRSWGYF